MHDIACELLTRTANNLVNLINQIFLHPPSRPNEQYEKGLFFTI